MSFWKDVYKRQDFQQSADFAKEIGLAKAHVFAYSVRPGTRAASMPDQVPQREKETRSARLIEVTDKTRQAFLQSQVGREEDVLFETTQTPYGIEGYTHNYTPVCCLLYTSKRPPKGPRWANRLSGAPHTRAILPQYKRQNQLLAGLHSRNERCV